MANFPAGWLGAVRRRLHHPLALAITGSGLAVLGALVSAVEIFRRDRLAEHREAAFTLERLAGWEGVLRESPAISLGAFALFLCAVSLLFHPADRMRIGVPAILGLAAGVPMAFVLAPAGWTDQVHLSWHHLAWLVPVAAIGGWLGWAALRDRPARSGTGKR